MISYAAENVKMPSIRRRATSTWLRRVAETYGKRVGEVGYLFVGDERMLEVNRQYLGHDFYTDIITFDYSEGNVLNGDIFISIDTVRDNSKKYNRSLDEELHRVIVHGLLHLCGVKDKGRARPTMERAENKALEML